MYVIRSTPVLCVLQLQLTPCLCHLTGYSPADRLHLAILGTGMLPGWDAAGYSSCACASCCVRGSILTQGRDTFWPQAACDGGGSTDTDVTGGPLGQGCNSTQSTTQGRDSGWGSDGGQWSCARSAATAVGSCRGAQSVGARAAATGSWLGARGLGCHCVLAWTHWFCQSIYLSEQSLFLQHSPSSFAHKHTAATHHFPLRDRRLLHTNYPHHGRKRTHHKTNISVTQPTSKHRHYLFLSLRNTATAKHMYAVLFVASQPGQLWRVLLQQCLQIKHITV